MIQKNVQDPLANLLLGGTVKDGDRVPVSVEAGHLVVGGLAVAGDDRPLPRTKLN